MNITVLMSTMNKNSIDELELKRKNIKNCIIVNQTSKQIETQKKDNCCMVSYDEKGLSKSRNRLIENCTEDIDIGIITDDDVSFVKDYNIIVEKAYEEINDADIIIFKSIDENGKPRRKYSNKNKKLKKFDLLKVCSIEITFRVKSIKDRIKFDEEFGLAGKYKSGEENIFLEECRRNGFNIYFYDEFINVHPAESTGMTKWTREDIYDKGALFKKLFPVLSYFMVMPICILKKTNLDIKLIDAIRTMYKGINEYAKRVNEK